MARTDAQRVFGFFVLVAVLVVVGSLLTGRFFKAAAGAETDVVVTLKGLEKDGLTVPIPGASEGLVSQQLHYDRITVTVAPDKRRAQAVATLDYRGKLGPTQVSSLGSEDLVLSFKNDAWVPEAGWAPLLTGTVTLLERRRLALEAGEGPGLLVLVPPELRGNLLTDPRLLQAFQLKNRSLEAVAYYLRTERDQTLVTVEEHWRGDLPDRPVDQTVQRRLRVVRRGQEFLFADGVM